MEVQSTLEEERVALDPRAIDCEPQIALVEELENFIVDFHNPPKSLQVSDNLPPMVKEKLKRFLHCNLDVFPWKHQDMVGIDPKVSCHHLKINPKANPHR